ncbi:MAG: paaD [Ramlibacter sp.]|nr:paaD [Ramlibacter sp.]
MTSNSAVERAWALLEQVTDPEIPVVSIRELGILREVNEREGEIDVVITPTYSGCPAMGQIEDDVRTAMAAHPLQVNVRIRLAPAWSTDWISDAAKDKLRAYGIAPPHTAQAAERVVQFSARSHDTGVRVACPHCGSADTTETSHFGSTACKALYKCFACLEPFDYFKSY